MDYPIARLRCFTAAHQQAIGEEARGQVVRMRILEARRQDDCRVGALDYDLQVVLQAVSRVGMTRKERFGVGYLRYPGESSTVKGCRVVQEHGKECAVRISQEELMRARHAQERRRGLRFLHSSGGELAHFCL